MITLSVPDMHCPNCVKRIQKSFDGEGLKCTIDLDKRTVTVEDGEVTAAIELLDDLGFEAKA